MAGTTKFGLEESHDRGWVWDGLTRKGQGKVKMMREKLGTLVLFMFLDRKPIAGVSGCYFINENNEKIHETSV